MIKKDLFDTSASLYVLSCLMRKPLLLQDDHYAFCKTDFYKPLQQIVFYAVFNMAQEGVEKITPQDVDRYISQYGAQYSYYKENKGFEFVNQCYATAEGSDDKQFEYYYNRLKKFSMLRDLEDMGYDTSTFYDTNKNALNRDIEDEKLNKISLNAIPEVIRQRLVEIENRHVGKDQGNSQNAAKGLRALVEQYIENPEVGLPLDGRYVNWATRGARLGKLYLYSAPSGGGKALPNDTLIPMFEGGFKQVGDVKIGDVLIDRHGKPTKVLKVFPQGKKDIYKITFKDGRTALCNDEHLWTIHNQCARDYNKLETFTLREIINKINEKGYKANKGFRYSVPLNEEVEYDKKDFKLDPYILGLLIGDGSFREAKSNRNLSFSTKDEEMLISICNTMNWTYKRNSTNNYSHYFKDKNNNNVHITEFCEEYDIKELTNKLTEDKVIPNEYLYGSIEQRYSLLQGLLDTDGSVDIGGRVSFSTINYKLAKQVQQLCWSLGMFCNIIEDKRKEKYTTGVCYQLTIASRPEQKLKMFRLSRKKERVENWFNNNNRKEKNIYNPIILIEEIKNTTEMTCFLVDNEEHLFLMNDYIVTHNTRYMLGNACAISMPYIDENKQVVMREDFQKVLFVATEMQADEIQTLLLAHVSGVNEKSILLGNYNADEKERIKMALDIIDKYSDNFIIECIPDPSIAMIKARLIKYIVQDSVHYIFYDYIFTSPSLVTEFSSADVKEYVALMMLSNTLKEIAMSYNVFIQSATQLNDGWSKNKIGLRDQNCLRGSKAIAD